MNSSFLHESTETEKQWSLAEGRKKRSQPLPNFHNLTTSPLFGVQLSTTNDRNFHSHFIHKLFQVNMENLRNDFKAGG